MRLFVAVILGIYLLSIIETFSMSEMVPHFGHIEELLSALLIPYAFFGMKFLFLEDRKTLFVVLIVVMVPALGALYGEFYKERFFLQFMLDLKFIYWIFVGYSLWRWQEKLPSMLTFVGRYIIAISVPLVIFQWVNPESYSSLFSRSEINSSSSLLSIERAVGVFSHPTIMGYISGIYSLYFAINYFIRRSSADGVYLVASVFVLIATQERQEILALILVLLVLATMLYFRRTWFAPLFSAATAFLSIFLIISLYSGSAERVYENIIIQELGLDDVENSVAPRVVVMLDSVRLANDAFPGGVGLGMFGGSVAVASESHYFHDLGYESYVWYDGVTYLQDMYWSKPLAESGWFGLLAYAVFFIFIFARLLRCLLAVCVNRGGVSSLVPVYAFSWFLYSLIVSITAPVFYDSLFLASGAFLIGIALRDITVRTVHFAEKKRFVLV